jgi:hypothetical protein
MLRAPHWNIRIVSDLRSPLSGEHSRGCPVFVGDRFAGRLIPIFDVAGLSLALVIFALSLVVAADPGAASVVLIAA